jgi:hypothetical protein
VGEEPTAPNGGKEGRSRRETLVAAATIIGVLIAAAGLWLTYSATREDKNSKSRAQAERVSATLQAPDPSDTSGATTIELFNHSDTPVTHAVVTLVLVQGAGPRTGLEVRQNPAIADTWQRELTTIPPGRSETEVSADWGAPGARPGVELAFTDSNGKHWLRPADGSLRSIPKPADAYYGIPEPIDWQSPRLIQ